MLTLAAGIGANSATFSFVSAVLLRPLPIPDLDRVVSVSKTKPSRESLLSGRVTRLTTCRPTR